ncbi:MULTISPECIES: hypothetical protein [Cupriavidus]
MRTRYRIACLLGAGAVVALGMVAGVMTAVLAPAEESAGAGVAAADMRAAVDAALRHCDDACRQSRGIAAVTALGHRPPP